MTKLLFAAALVAALAVVAITAKPLSANDPSPVTCFECTLLGDLVQVMRKQGKTKDQIDQQAQTVCARLPEPLNHKCVSAVASELDPLLDALEKSNGDVKAACLSLSKCAAAVLEANPLDCIACEVEAALIKKAIETNTKDQIVGNMAVICNKIMNDDLKKQCLDKINTQIVPLVDELIKNPTDTVKQACVVVMRCDASIEEELEQLVARSDNPKADCLVCGLEAKILGKALKNNTKADIDAKLAQICAKLPVDQWRVNCNQKVAQKLDPIIDELVKNPSEDAKKVCQVVSRCPADEIEQELMELVQEFGQPCHTRNCLPSAPSQNITLDCVVCAVEAGLLGKCLKNNTKADIDAKLAKACAKLPVDQWRVNCNQKVTQKLDPLMDEIAKNPNENPKQVCAAIAEARCPKDSIDEEDFEELAAVAAPSVNVNPKVDCAICGLEATLLAKALNNKSTKQQIDDKLMMVCNKLPANLSASCKDAVNTKLNPLIDALVANMNDPKMACQTVQRCPA